MSRLMLVIGLILMSLSGIGQANSADVQSINDSWQNYYENDLIKIEVRKQSCNFPSDGVHQEFLLFRYMNKSSNTITVDLHNDRYYNGNCTTCGSNEYDYTFSIKPNSMITSECDLQAPGYKSVFVKQLNFKSSSVLTSISLENIKVTEDK